MAGPTTRVLALLELLQAHGRLTGAEMARRLGVDPRTVRRYITVLEDLGIPVTTEQGRHGGYMLVAGFRLPPMMLTNEETLAISLGLLAARHLGLTETDPALASVQAKLERVMPDNLRDRLRAAGETTSLVLPGARGHNRALPTLADAIQSRRRLRMQYHSRKDECLSREVDPYGLVFHHGHWYLSGYCHRRDALRSFRLDRMMDVRVLAVSFERPPDFDAAEHLRSSLADAWPRYEVSVLLHADGESARDLFRCPEAAVEVHAEGTLVRTSTDSLEWFARWLSSLPVTFRVLAPGELNDILEQHAQRLLAACR